MPAHGLEKTLRVLPMICFSALSTHTGHPNDWTMSSDSSYSSESDSLSTQSSLDHALGAVALEKTPTSLINKATSPDQRQVQSQLALRPTCAVTSTDPTVPVSHFLSQIVQSVNNKHCLSITKALWSPILEQEVSVLHYSVAACNHLVLGFPQCYTWRVQSHIDAFIRR